MSHVLEHRIETRRVWSKADQSDSKDVVVHVYRYLDDIDRIREVEYVNEPSPATIEAWNPRHRDARQFVADAKAAWTTATTNWNAAAALPQSTAAEKQDKALAELVVLHEGQIAIMKAIRAIALAGRAEDSP